MCVYFRSGFNVLDDTAVKCAPLLHDVSRQATASAKIRVEQDRLRRARQRDNQLQEAGKSRFKETLSQFEKIRAAERERVKGNESFKVRDILSRQMDDSPSRLVDSGVPNSAIVLLPQQF